MKRLRLVGTSLLIAIGALMVVSGPIASGGAAKSKVKKVKTKVNLTYKVSGEDPYQRAVFKGVVKAKKGCKDGRAVKIKGIGQTTSNAKGKFTLPAGGGAFPGRYKAVAKPLKLKKGGKVISCRKGTSKKVRVT